MTEEGAEDEWETFFSENLQPSNFEEARDKMTDFCAKHKERGVALVTSGGTTVPLELNTVRYVDNFSAGTRGATSAEYFLRNGYAVIFLYRDNSLRPFSRFLPGSSMLEWLQVTADGKIEVSKEKTNFVKNILQEFYQYSDRLLEIRFTSLADYLWMLRLSSQVLNSHARSILYLAAAVSDFYVPTQHLPTHKIQSSEGPPAINLKIVPKMLRPLVGKWATHCYITSFKLETDPKILISKSKQALEKYGHHLVIGNILETRKREVWIVSEEGQNKIEMSPEELANCDEIEKKIVGEVLTNAAKFWKYT